jgi:hypothetical protein
MRQRYDAYPELGKLEGAAKQAKGGRRDNYNRVTNDDMEAGMTPKDFDNERAPRGDRELAQRTSNLEFHQEEKRKDECAKMEAESLKAAQLLQEQADEEERVNSARIAADEAYARTQEEQQSLDGNGNDDAQQPGGSDKSLIVNTSGMTGSGRVRAQRQRTAEEMPFESDEEILRRYANLAAKEIMHDFDMDFQYPRPKTSIGLLIRDRLKITIDQYKGFAVGDYLSMYLQQHELLNKTRNAFNEGVLWADYVAAIKAEMTYALRATRDNNKHVDLLKFALLAMSPFRCNEEKHWFEAIFSAIMAILQARGIQESAQPMHVGRGGGPGPGGRGPQGGRGARNSGTDTSSRSSRMTNGTQDTSSSGEHKYHGS